MMTSLDLLLSVAIMTIMLSLGLGLHIKDFAILIRRSELVAAGLFIQICIIPISTFCVISVCDITGATAVGFMLLAACPGGGVSNVFSKIAKVDVPLSIVLTTLSSLLCAITIPLVLGMSARVFLNQDLPNLDVWRLARRAFVLCTAPIVSGILIRNVLPNIAHLSERILSKVALVFLAAIIIGAMIASWSAFWHNLWFLGAALLAMLLTHPLLGYLLPRSLDVGEKQARTLAIEASVQNGALGIAVASLISQGSGGFSDFALASALYRVLSYFVVVPLSVYFRHTPTPDGNGATVW